MPNQKDRKKKDGVNKGKKLAAMREKEAGAKPAVVHTGTGKQAGREPKTDRVSGRRAIP
jgi:hypothetical protein